MIKVKFYSDPGHGWYAVKTKELAALGLLDKISSSSYQSVSKKTVYLEEDRDATLFFKTCEEKKASFKIVKEVSQDPSSPIRKYPNYQKSKEVA